FTGQEPLDHKKTHSPYSYRVMDKLEKCPYMYDEEWTAAEELSLADQTRKHGLGAWEEIADSKLFYRGKSASELHTRYLDTYLSQYGSVLPPHYLKQREDGTVEKVPIPLTDPDNCDPALRGVKVCSREIRSRTIAELGTNPQYRYEPSWQALAKREEDAKAAAAAAATTAAETAAAASAVAAATADAAAAAAATAATAAAAAASSGSGIGNGLSNGGGGGAAGGGGSATADVGVDGEDGKSNGNAARVSGVGGQSEEGAKASQNRKKKKKVDKVNKNKEEERAIKEWVEKLPGADLSVYAPLRGDFDHEHDDSAEELLANMEFRSTDHISEKQLKLDVIAVYNHRLDEREKRKRFVIEHNLLDYKKQQMGGKKRLREDRELVARLRPFARFSTPKEHDELIDNLLLAKKIRARIEQLQVYRQNGITTLAEGLEFDRARQRRQDELASQKHRESASYLYDGHSNGKGTTGDRNKRYSNRNKGGMSDGTGEGADARSDNLLNLTGAPGVEFLSPPERLLCSELHLLPGYYLVIKEAMIQECVRAGFLKRNNLSGLILMDCARLEKV
ncbi:unnamed protein product, partial [Laminaria digitata]